MFLASDESSVCDVVTKSVSGTGLFKAVCARDLEGIVAKHRLGPYEAVPMTWFKILNPDYIDFASAFHFSSKLQMGRQVANVLYVVAMVAVIVGVDFVFFRNRFWERLAVNVGIVLVFVAFYFRFLRRP